MYMNYDLEVDSVILATTELSESEPEISIVQPNTKTVRLFLGSRNMLKYFLGRLEAALRFSVTRPGV